MRQGFEGNMGRWHCAVKALGRGLRSYLQAKLELRQFRELCRDDNGKSSYPDPELITHSVSCPLDSALQQQLLSACVMTQSLFSTGSKTRYLVLLRGCAQAASEAV